MNKAERNVAKVESIEGDYYFENGLCVFTAQYLKRRGYCCGNGCRHCPYTSTKKTTTQKEMKK